MALWGPAHSLSLLLSSLLCIDSVPPQQGDRDDSCWCLPSLHSPYSLHHASGEPKPPDMRSWVTADPQLLMTVPEMGEAGKATVEYRGSGYHLVPPPPAQAGRGMQKTWGWMARKGTCICSPQWGPGREFPEETLSPRRIHKTPQEMSVWRWLLA
jgi:hypothetical protein